MELKDGFKRMAGSGKYIYFNQGRYSVNEWDLTGSGRSINYATAYNGGLNGKNFFMESGGNAQPDQGVTNPDTFNALSWTAVWIYNFVRNQSKKVNIYRVKK